MEKGRKRIPLGVRNCNPLNIRDNGAGWVGKTGVNKGFCVFSSLIYGYRAAFRLLNNYNVLHGCWSIRSIIQRWAPENENNTVGYIKRVCELVGCVDNYIISIKDPDMMVEALMLVRAMASVENGVPYDNINPEPIKVAYDVAFHHREGWGVYENELSFYKKENEHEN